MRRARHQQGSSQRAKRKRSGETVWVFRWREVQMDETKRYRKAVIGTVADYKTEHDNWFPTGTQTRIGLQDRNRRNFQQNDKRELGSRRRWRSWIAMGVSSLGSHKRARLPIDIARVLKEIWYKNEQIQ
jgi:hypothetical protein